VRGNITRRGRASWRLKFDIGRDPITRERLIRFVTVRGKRQDAEKELTRLIAAAYEGKLIEPIKLTLAEFLASWLEGTTNLSAKTLERYQQLVKQQIVPHLGASLLQKLRPAQIQQWHTILLRKGGKDGKPLSARTVRHAHRVLHRALENAVKAEFVSRNVAHAITPPKVESKEVAALTAGQMFQVLKTLEGHKPYRQLGTGQWDASWRTPGVTMDRY
jgi:integrase